MMENIKKAIKKTFYYKIIITKIDNKKNIYIQHINPLFDLEINELNLNVKTKYLSPCMYLKNIINKYEKDDDNNYIICEKGIYMNNTEIEFNIKDSIPIDFLIITKLFSFTYNTPNMCKNISNINIFLEKNEKLLEKYIEQYVNNFKIIEPELKNIWNDYKKYGIFKINNNKWITSDPGVGRFSTNEYFSEYTKNILSTINKKLDESLFNNSNLDKNLYYKKIHAAHKFQGGLNLKCISSIFGNNYLYNNNESIIRCCGNSVYWNNMYWRNNMYNVYNLNESDIQSIIIFNEFLKKENISTTLTFDNQTFTFYANQKDYSFLNIVSTFFS